MRLLKAISMSFLMMAMIVTVAKGDQMITSGTRVTMDYTLTVEGNVVDTSEGRGPLEYVQGQGMLIPGLEKELEGLKPGDEKNIQVGPEEAYGMPDPEAVIEVPRQQLSPDQEPQIGMILQTQTPEGQPLQGVIVEVEDQSVLIDFNHPLAGKTLEFDVNIVSTE